MLIGVFKSNQKLLNVLIVLLTIIMWIPSFWIENTTVTPENSLFVILINAKSNNIVNFLLGVFLISAQAMYLNFIVNEYKLVTNNTHLIGLFYVLLNCMEPSLLVLNPIIVANCFVLFSIHLLFKIYNEKETYALSFNTALLIGLATLFYLPLLILFPFIWVVLLYTGTPKWRDFIISIMGLLIPFIYYTSYYFIKDDFTAVLNLFSANCTIFHDTGEEIKRFDNYFLILISLVGILSGFKLIQTVQKSVIKIRKLKMVLLIMMCSLMITVLFNGRDYLSTYLLISIPFAVFLANYFNEVRRAWWGEFLFLSIVVSIAFNYFS